MQEYLQVDTTFPSEERANAVVLDLVRQRLVACGQIFGPITSIYRWEGKIETKVEWRGTFKTRRDRYDLLEQALRELHPYDTPEIQAVLFADADVRYMRWIDEALDGESGIWSRRKPIP